MILSDKAVVPNQGSAGKVLHPWCLGLIYRPPGHATVVPVALGDPSVVGSDI